MLEPVPSEPGLRTKTYTLNMGPQHPSTHGVLRLLLELDGEEIIKCIPDMGYLHRAMEKLAENKTFHQFTPYTDRLDYLSPFHNNTTYMLTVEKLIGIEAPKRAQYIRTVGCELARISSHLLGLGTWALDVGAMTVFFLTFREREVIYNLFEMLTGARMMTSFARVGGVAADIDSKIETAIRNFLAYMPDKIDDYEDLLTHNRIWLGRTKGIGIFSAEQATALSLTGPNLRASGVNWDLRVQTPYMAYEDFDFDVPLGETGDIYDRYTVRIEEMRQSLRIIRQALDGMPEGPYQIDDPKITLPKKEDTYGSMEELIHHFKIVCEGVAAPPGEVYFAAENPKGELGFYIVGDGTSHAYRLHIRSPSFISIGALPTIVEGRMLSDVVAALGSVDIVLGECDR
ncbi:MAG: NADH-quinone oxidoreductase subunit D [Candidatus Eisenbacteria bacterium]|uniref:NADH-quinone oxidoreductase subunit D n=1 Tax=Eiseniibacteriota bacterium TaxID=2212470 RepID=A0A7Y2EAI3_UNCEI|nr:NADH-quinone oxidoreductase subunit D [Candidatus Eisenbacteria bacterium]